MGEKNDHSLPFTGPKTRTHRSEDRGPESCLPRPRTDSPGGHRRRHRRRPRCRRTSGAPGYLASPCRPEVRYGTTGSCKTPHRETARTTMEPGSRRSICSDPRHCSSVTQPMVRPSSSSRPRPEGTDPSAPTCDDDSRNRTCTCTDPTAGQHGPDPSSPSGETGLHARPRPRQPGGRPPRHDEIRARPLRGRSGP